MPIRMPVPLEAIRKHLPLQGNGQKRGLKQGLRATSLSSRTITEATACKRTDWFSTKGWPGMKRDGRYNPDVSVRAARHAFGSSYSAPQSQNESRNGSIS